MNSRNMPIRPIDLHLNGVFFVGLCCCFLVLISCTSKTIEGTAKAGEMVTGAQDHKLTAEVDKAGAPALIALLQSKSPELNLLWSSTTLNQVYDLYVFRDELHPERIGKLESGTRVDILGKTQTYQDKQLGKGYYLIQIVGSRDLWSGWIEQTAIDLQKKEQGNQFYLYTGYINISKDNQIFAISLGWMKSIFVFGRTGNEIANIQYTELKAKNPASVDGSIIGWSTDNKYVWFDTNMDAYVASFGRISTDTGVYTLIDRPKTFASYEIQINYDTGDAIYTDYPYQFDTETAAATKKSGKVFHLYKNNLLNPNEISISENSGDGFQLSKSENGELLFRTSSKDSFVPVQF